jgi:methionyl-tRNA synthetase
LLREIPYGQDGDFSEAKMKELYNGHLANGLGNFAARVLTLAEKEEFKSLTLDAEFEKEIALMNRMVHQKLHELKFPEALAAVWAAIAFGDRYVNEEKAWEIKDEKKRRQALFNLVVLLDAVALVLVPFLPEASKKIKEAITHDGTVLHAKKIDILFPRLK